MITGANAPVILKLFGVSVLKNKILIVSSKDDVHTDSVINNLTDKYDNEVIRLNTEDFAQNAKVSFDGVNILMKLNDSGISVNSDEIGSVWFRRPRPIESDHIRKNVASFISDEWNAFLRGLYFCTHDTATWVNPLPALHRARIKLQQIQLAHRLGMKVPDTVVSNDFSVINEFYDKHKNICAKTLDKPSFKEGKDHYLPIYTKIVSKEDLISQKNNIALSPAIYQQFIKKKYDIRVIIIGEVITAFAIHTKSNTAAEVDFRHGFTGGLEHEVITLPVEVKSKIIQFVQAQRLNFSAIDLILDEEEEYWFLENNPNGQWLWLEFATKFPLTKIMCEYLTGIKSNKSIQGTG